MEALTSDPVHKAGAVVRLADLGPETESIGERDFGVSLDFASVRVSTLSGGKIE